MDNVAPNESGRIDKDLELALPIVDKTPQPDSFDRKAELRRRVEARIADLEKALAATEEPSEGWHDLMTSIRFARNRTCGGWERISDADAAALATWLETSEDLRVTSPGLPMLRVE